MNPAARRNQVTRKRKHNTADLSKIVVGPCIGQVSPPMYWKSLKGDRLRGALFLAHQQYLDGLGANSPQWMGLTEEQHSQWMRDPEWLPKGRE